MVFISNFSLFLSLLLPSPLSPFPLSPPSLPFFLPPPPPLSSPSQVDDSATVAEITKTVCDRIGISNPEEFFLCTESETAEVTLRRVSARQT